MKILIVYPNAEGYGRIPLGMSIIATLLHNAGHQIEVFDTTFLRGDNVDNTIRQQAGFVLSTDTAYLYSTYTDEEIDMMLREKVKQFSPDIVAVSIVEDNYRYAHRLLSVIKEVDSSIVVLAGGSTPTVVPHIVMENPCIDYVIQGEGEGAVVEFCDLMECGKSVEGIRNVWFSKNGRIKGNPIRPFIDMNVLPIQNLDFWDERHFTKPYAGKIYRSGYYEMSRGCLNKCTYCINHSLQNCLHSAGRYYRRKSIESAITEIRTHKDKYKLERIFFTDDNFLFMPSAVFDEFVTQWNRKINLPYWINTTVETLNSRRLGMLKATGCDGISIGVESGSEWLRRNILNRKIKNETIIKGFKLVHDFGIRTSSNIMIGFPGECEADIFESIKLLKRIRPGSMDATFVTPYIGTNIHKLAWKLGYIDVLDTLGFRGFAANISMRKPCIRIPQVNNKNLVKVFNDFSGYVNGTIPIPDKYVSPTPGSSKTEPPRGDMGKQEAAVLKDIIFSMSKRSLHELDGINGEEGGFAK